MSNLSQVRNGLVNQIRDFTILLGNHNALSLKAERLEIDTEVYLKLENFHREELLVTFQTVNEFGAEFPSSILLHVTNEHSKIHISNGNEGVFANKRMVSLDLLQNTFN